MSDKPINEFRSNKSAFTGSMTINFHRPQRILTPTPKPSGCEGMLTLVWFSVNSTNVKKIKKEADTPTGRPSVESQRLVLSPDKISFKVQLV